MKLYKYILTALSLVLLLLIVNCPKEPTTTVKALQKEIEAKTQNSIVKFILDKEDSLSVVLGGNLKKICEYAKLPFSNVTISDWNKNNTDSGESIVFVLNTKKINDKGIQKLHDFVTKGGTLILPNLNIDRRVSYLIGLKPRANYVLNSSLFGFVFKKTLMPNLTGKELLKNITHTSLEKNNFTGNPSILATPINDQNFPLITQNKVGEGKVLYLNSQHELSRQERGLLFSFLLSGLEGIPYPIANVSTIFIDDFPSPVYPIKAEPIASEMDLNISEFISEVWWEDMKKLADTLDIKYTTIPCFNYKNNTEPSFVFQEWNSEKITKNNIKIPIADWITEDVVNSRHELGLHGYNHVSLLQSDWNHMDDIIIAMQAVKKKWKVTNFGELPVSYVPPSNEIDSVGIAKLMQGMPSLKYMCSLYLGEKEHGGGRDYDPDPYYKDLFDFPRVTHGYVLTNDHEFEKQSLYLYTGIWSHFIHPDDVYQIENNHNQHNDHYALRNKAGLGWRVTKGNKKGMYPLFKEYLINHKKLFPMSAYYTTADAAEITKQWRGKTYTHKSDLERYEVFSTNEKNTGQHWFMYVSASKLELMENDLVEKNISYSKTSILDGFLLTIHTPENKLNVINLRTHQATKQERGANELGIQNSYEQHLALQNEYINFDLRIDDFIANQNVFAAAQVIKNRLFSQKYIDEDLWITYFEYMSWIKKIKIAWDDFEAYCTQEPLKENILFATTLDKKNGYPNIKYKQKWLKKIISISTDDPSLIKDYLLSSKVNHSDENTTKLYKKLYKLEPTAENFRGYLSHLLTINSKQVATLLHHKTPCENKTLDSLNSTIAWYFAKHKKYRKAIKWASCNNDIKDDSKLYWYINIDSLPAIKQLSLLKYYEQLLNKHPKLAKEELNLIPPCKDSTLTYLSTQISWFYADKKDYQNALDWSNCSKDIKITDKLHWLYELKKYKELERTYKSYITNHPNDNDTKVTMVKLYHAMKEFKKSWILGNTLNDNYDKETIQALLNRDVKYVDVAIQKVLLKDHSDLFYVEVKKEIIKNIRLLENDNCDIKSIIQSDNNETTNIFNQISYNRVDKKLNTHSFSTSYSIFNKLSYHTAEENIDNKAYGLQYQFKKRNIPNKLNYWAQGGIDISKQSKLYYMLNIGATISKKEQRYSSLTFKLNPVNTTVAYNLGIYELNLVSYIERPISKKQNLSASFENTFYTDNVFNSILIGKSHYRLIDDNLKVYPLIEVAGSLSNVGYSPEAPYWVVKKRFYYGGGSALNYISHSKKISLNTEFSYFIDEYTGDFYRFFGGLSYNFSDYTVINSNFEYYTYSSFSINSNYLIFSVKHTF